MSFSEEYIVESRVFQKTYQDSLKCLKDSVEKKYQFDTFNKGRTSLLKTYEARTKVENLQKIQEQTKIFEKEVFQNEMGEINGNSYDEHNTKVFNKYKKIFQFSDWVFRKYFTGFDMFEFDTEGNTNDNLYEIMDNGISKMKADIESSK